MTAVKYVMIMCDCDPCPDHSHGPCGSEEGPMPSVEAARELGRTLNWRIRRGDDRCPPCREHP